MNFEEHAAKPLLAAAGIPVPRGRLATTPEEAAAVAAEQGPVVVKAQIPAGKRGKAGGIVAAADPVAAAAAAERILGMQIGEHRVERVLVEARAAIAREFYAAVLNDPATGGPLVMFASAGGMDVEELARTHPRALRRLPVDIGAGFDEAAAEALVEGLGLGASATLVSRVLARLYRVYLECDAELLEINPLALLDDGNIVALDCKLVLDDSAVGRQAALSEHGTPERMSELERRGRDIGLRFIELDGEVGVLANGAGLTMTTMDVIAHRGGRPANFLEIGGEAYTKARPALELVLANPRVKSLVVNFCGAFARTDVMTAGVVDAWQALGPDLPVHFSVHGTGAAEAVALLRERLGIEPYATMDDAVAAAIESARHAGPARGRRT